MRLVVLIAITAAVYIGKNNEGIAEEMVVKKMVNNDTIQIDSSLYLSCSKRTAKRDHGTLETTNV